MRGATSAIVPYERLDVEHKHVPFDEVSATRIKEVVEYGLRIGWQVNAVFDVLLKQFTNCFVEFVRQAVEIRLDMRLLIDYVIVFGVVFSLKGKILHLYLHILFLFLIVFLQPLRDRQSSKYMKICRFLLSWVGGISDFLAGSFFE